MFVIIIFLIAKDFILNDANTTTFRFHDYQYANSQGCFTKETSDEIKAMSEFIKEPFAWLLGQSFKYLFHTTKYFDTLLKNSLRDMKIDFNYPIVGYLKVTCTSFVFSYVINFDFYLLKKSIHVRRGLKIIGEAKAYGLDQYMIYVKDFYDKYFIKNPSRVGKIKRSVYLVTEEPKILDELKE